MRPTIRSRLAASAVAFGLGFVIANCAVLFLQRPDNTFWLVVAGVLIGTSAIGVLFADTRRNLSVWALIGTELFVVFTLLPVVWLVSLATAPAGEPVVHLVPGRWTGDAFVAAWSTFHSAMAHSLFASAAATLVAVPLGLGAAYTIAVVRPRGHRLVRFGVGALVLAPLLAWAVPVAHQVRLLADAPVLTVFALLVVAVPLATWLLIPACEQVQWQVIDSVRAAGASWRTVVSAALVPQFLPPLAAVSAAVFVAGCLDFVAGAAVSATAGPLPVRLLATSDPSLIAAAGLIWMVPSALVLVLFAAPLTRLVGRS